MRKPLRTLGIYPGEVSLPRVEDALTKKAPRFPGELFSGLPSVAGNPGLLKETDVAPTRGKSIRIARALLVTAGSEGSDRK